MEITKTHWNRNIMFLLPNIIMWLLPSSSECSCPIFNFPKYSLLLRPVHMTGTSFTQWPFAVALGQWWCYKLAGSLGGAGSNPTEKDNMQGAGSGGCPQRPWRIEWSIMSRRRRAGPGGTQCRCHRFSF